MSNKETLQEYNTKLDNNNTSLDSVLEAINELPSSEMFATNEYVDEQLSTKQPLLTAGENITIDENNIISAIGGNVDTSNIQEFPTIDLTDYISYTESGSSINITDAGKAKLSELFTNYYKRHNTLVGLNFTINSRKYNPRGFKMLMLYRDELSAGNAYFHQIMFATDLDIGSMSYTSMNFAYTVGEDGTVTLGRIGDWGSDFKNGLSRNRIKDYFLAKSNTTSFTPTEDYHPATKKYVDDAVSAAITAALEGEY